MPDAAGIPEQGLAECLVREDGIGSRTDDRLGILAEPQFVDSFWPCELSTTMLP